MTTKIDDGCAEWPEEGNWSPRMMALREAAEDIGKGFHPDEDWMPLVMVDGIMPESLPDGSIPPAAQIGKPALIMVGLPDSMRNEETKDRTAEIMTLLAIRLNAIGMTFISTVWMSIMPATSEEEIQPNETEEQQRERIYREAKAFGQPSEDPNRKERLMMHSIYFGGLDDGQKLAHAEIRRQKGKPPKLYDWKIWDEGIGGFIGRFPDAIYEGLKIAAELRDKEDK